MKALNIEQPNQKDQANQDFAAKLSKESRRAFQKANQPEEAELMDKAEAGAGEAVLASTLELIREQLKKKTGADDSFDRLAADAEAVAEIKRKLMENLRQDGNDRREEIVEEMVDKLAN